MGLFNWLMTGLGVETEEKKDKKVKQTQTEDKYANFNLHEKAESETIQEEPTSASNIGFGPFGIQSDSHFIVLDPRDKKDIQHIVDYLKQGQTVGVNLENIAEQDRDRILDFLSGAIYALNGSIVQWKGDLFVLTPEGHKILRPDENGENK